jgi:hypothetical protein
MERALRARGLGVPISEAALRAARWLPTLTLGATVERALAPSAHDQTTVLAALSWPVDERTSGVGLEHERLRRTTTLSRRRLLDRIAEAWQRRRHADTLADAIEAQLSAEEADAELDVLTGGADGDGP